MNISPHEFKAAGEELVPGRKTRIDHSCGEGKTLIVSRVPKGISAYCFRCHLKGFIPAQLSIAERIAALAEANQADAESRQEVHLPAPGVMDVQKWPDWARLWLYKAGFSNDMIRSLGFYYHERMQRVVMPVKDNGELVYWQARGNNPDLPKYINPQVDKARLVYKQGTPGDVLVLTEDMLSAAKVGLVGWAWSLMGTSLSLPLALQIASLSVPVIVALDPDAAGRAGGNAIVKSLSLLGVPCRTAYMERDPKFHSRQEIATWIKQTVLSFTPSG